MSFTFLRILPLLVYTLAVLCVVEADSPPPFFGKLPFLPKPGKLKTKKLALPKRRLSVGVSLRVGGSFVDAVYADKAKEGFTPYLRPSSKSSGTFVVDEKQNSITMFAYTTDEDIKGKVFFSKPVFFPMNGDILSVSTNDWDSEREELQYVAYDGKGDDAAIKKTADGTPVNVQFSCLQKGESKVMVYLTMVPAHDQEVNEQKKGGIFQKPKQPEKGHERKLLGSSSSGPSKRLISFVMVKRCAAPSEEEEPVQNTGIEGLMIGIGKNSSSVANNGVVNPPFSDMSKIHIVPPKHVATSFSVRYKRHMDSKSKDRFYTKLPVVTSQFVDVCSPTVTGELAAEQTFLTATPQTLTVTYNCLKEGTSIIDIQLPTSQGVVSFSVLKECTDFSKAEGNGVKGLKISTSIEGKADVVKDGFTLPLFKASEEEEDELKAKRFTVDGDTDSISFYLQLTKKHSKQEFDRPIVIANAPNQYGEEEKESGVGLVAFPVIGGGILETDSVECQDNCEDTVPMEVTFNCVRKGLASVSVIIPLRPSGQVKFDFFKTCDDNNSDSSILDKGEKLPGFNVGTTHKDLDDVVSNGLLSPQYHWTSNVDALNYYSVDDEYATFILSYEDPDAEARSKQTDGNSFSFTRIHLDAPTVVSHYSLISPVLAGSASQSIDIDHTEHHTLTVSFNCQKSGTSMLNLVLPLTIVTITQAKETAEVLNRRVRRENIILTFAKDCNLKEVEKADAVVPQGGIAIPGLSIGTTPGGSDVVQNGFPLASYFGQRLRINPDWDDIMVPTNVSALSLYLTYEASDGDSFVNFQSPTVLTHSSTFEVGLNGEASSGGRLAQSGNNTLELGVNFKCRFRGTSSATVSIPVLPHGVISLTIPKECSGKAKSSGTVFRGVMAGTGPKEADVLKDGKALPAYTRSKSSNRKDKAIVSNAAEQTSFFLWKEPSRGVLGKILFGSLPKEAATRILEPVVFSHRPICNPILKHSLRPEMVQVETKDATGKVNGTAMEATDSFFIDVDPQEIIVDYHCTWEGTTQITLLFPVLPRGQFSFTWTKECEDPSTQYYGSETGEEPEYVDSSSSTDSSDASGDGSDNQSADASGSDDSSNDDEDDSEENDDNWNDEWVNWDERRWIDDSDDAQEEFDKNM